MHWKRLKSTALPRGAFLRYEGYFDATRSTKAVLTLSHKGVTINQADAESVCC